MPVHDLLLLALLQSVRHTLPLCLSSHTDPHIMFSGLLLHDRSVVQACTAIDGTGD